MALDEQGNLHQIILVAIFLLTISNRHSSPFFFTGIDGDESTFILTAQSVLDGHLPYTDFWDIKPPVCLSNGRAISIASDAGNSVFFFFSRANPELFIL